MTSRWTVLLFAACAGLVHGATTCRFATGVSPIAFGNYDVFGGTPSDTQARVDVQCTRVGGPQNVLVSLGISQGTWGTSVANRRLRNPAGDFLTYSLYRDSARSAVWGVTDGVDTGTLSLSIANNGTASGSFVVYGRIQGGQRDISPGSYSDSVQLVLSP